ncbi:MAG TPA: hypothetical protein VFD50_09915 [Thermoleophilia bacterium]|nr:hypothetical protein [Thermoleophilia bacterium]
MSDDPGRAGAQTDEERARAYREQVRQLRAVDIASSLMLDLVTIGYQKLGLTPETADLRDLSDARLLIDLLRATLGVVENELDEMQRRDLHSTLAQMQLSFARAVQLGGGAESRPAEKAADAPAEEPRAAAEEPAPAAEPAETAAAPKAAAKKPAARKPAAKKKGAPRKPGGKAPSG